ncbi:AcrR family transcriptional regulator [Catenuloplanes nepalensis]|uniref:AcrR family transcriptional regulator n=1 Tax=Catenuloplanes nepalensis TaxID=587533 RepID=A0ABT9MNU6_9ACTN|nr:TetR/AcrR family transcriptional regulator [Catenuloplanes nepalensis]MDP9793117.1 AcrR family transcriptional regulator [Catenuloplanes nepalensis]
MTRRGSGTPTRDRIHVAAARLFRERGFAGTSVRDIAAAAEADPALVIRHFGSKELLFLDVVRPHLDESVFGGPLGTLGTRLVGMLLDVGEEFRPAYVALLQGSAEARIAEQLRGLHEQEFVAPLRARMTGADADARARTAAAMTGGMLYALWIVGDDRVAADRESFIRRYGGLLQRLITPDA